MPPQRFPEIDQPEAPNCDGGKESEDALVAHAPRRRSVLEVQLQAHEDSTSSCRRFAPLDDVTLGSPKRNKAEVKEAAQQEKAKALALSAEFDALVAENHPLVAKNEEQVRTNKFSTWISCELSFFLF